ncbi:hypothetical protein ACVWZR_002821 [Bradyrhizobium sp. i1.3.1]
MKTLLHPPGIFAKVGRECRHQLVLRGDHRRVQPERRGRSRQSRKEQGLRLVLRQAVQTHAITVEQAIAALRAAVGINGDAGRRERVDVAIDRAHRDLAGFRKLGRSDLPPGLEGGEDRQHSARAHDPLNHT